MSKSHCFITVERNPHSPPADIHRYHIVLLALKYLFGDPTYLSDPMTTVCCSDLHSVMGIRASGSFVLIYVMESERS